MNRWGRIDHDYQPLRATVRPAIRGTRRPARPATEEFLPGGYYITPNPFYPERKDPMSTVTKKVASDLRQNLAGFEKVFGVLAYTRSKSFSDVTVYVFPLVEWEPYTSYSYVDRGLVEAYTVQVPRPSTEVPQEIRSGVDMVLQSIDGRDHVADEPKGEFLQRLCRMGLFPFEWGTLHEADPGSILYWQLAALPVKEVSA